MLRNKLVQLISLLSIIILIPYIITIFLYDTEEKINNEEKKNTDYRVVMEVEGKEEEVDIEDYLVGVVAAEMPVSFHIEALKAQAVAARTYAIKQMENDKIIEANLINQSYYNDSEMREIWKNNYAEYYSKIAQAVQETEGEVMVYDDELIEAVFHSTSGGKTQSAIDIWEEEVPYLVSVDSQEDVNSKEYEQVFTIQKQEVIDLIKKNVEDFDCFTDDILESTQIISRTEAGYISSIQMGNKIFTGEEIRSYLELSSSNFAITDTEDEIIFTCKGYGHGVGMSQNGANYKAIDGMEYKEILEYYYMGITVKNLYISE